jgi:hypothetical protein
VGSVQEFVAVGLSGVAATGAVGSLIPGTPLTGVQATGNVGTLTAEIFYEVAITGVTGTGAVGDLQLQRTQAIIGNIIQGAVGNIRPLWVVIDDSQNADWQTINTAASTTWGSINAAQDPQWVPVNTN